MKRRMALCLVVLIVCSMVGCRTRDGSRREISMLVSREYDTIVKACQEQDTDTLLQLNWVEDVALEPGYVIVYCFGAGNAASSQYYGFYYTEENRPAGIDCNQEIVCSPEDMTPEGRGFSYTDKWHNSFYTEQIKGNIYFYGNAY